MKEQYKMKACSKCKEVKSINRFSKGRPECKDCHSAYYRLYYKKNKEQRLAAGKVWHENNRDQRLAQMKAWRENNKEHQAKSMKAWCQYNLDHLALYRRGWREKNSEQEAQNRKLWHENNPEKNRQYCQNRRAMLIGVTATLTDQEWQEIWEEFDGKCFWCGDIATTIEHIVPLRPRPGGLQGHHTKENVVPACRPCNNSKLNMDPFEFYFKRQMKMNKLEEAEC